MPFLSLRPQPEPCRLIQGHVLDALAGMADESVHAVITSPPYFGLRQYKCDPVVWGVTEGCEHKWGVESVVSGSAQTQGATSQRKGRSNVVEQQARNRSLGSVCTQCGAWLGSLGLEPTPEMYVEHLVEIFRGVRRILRDNGLLFLVIGDSYARSAAKGQHKPGDSGKQAYIYDRGGGRASSCANLDSESRGSSDDFVGRGDKAPVRIGGAGLKAKDLVGIPWLVALALRNDGWYLRSSIIWEKKNPLPESVQDRCTRSHEYVFMLSKSELYYYDSLAVAEPLDRPNEHLRKTPGKFGGAGKWVEASKQNRTHSGREYVGTPTGTRNCRDVWNIATQPSKLKFYAAFPEKLAERCILAGSSARGCCSKCGAGWVRVTKSVRPDPSLRAVYAERSSKHLGADRNSGHRRLAESVTAARRATGDHDNPFQTPVTLGFRPACPHYDDRYRAEFPRSRSTRKRAQRDASGDWWKRVRRRPGKDDWPAQPAIVCDPFCGSGTAGLAALRLGRRFIGVDLSPEYTEMARQRIEKGRP